ncbi:MAG: hypothetical protein LBQ34_02815 [Alphaproteobacteria bacterium]|jgi:hypothetical protein|nr:hypothetical protein [Alphaproteobacteria bacterium]
MKTQSIALLLSKKNTEIIESILKNSNHFYEIITNFNIKANVLITEDSYLEKIELDNFQKIICIIPKYYLDFIDKKFKLNKITFIELPITYEKLINSIVMPLKNGIHCPAG